MPRMARVVIPGVPHHVTQRGNRQEEVFLREADYRRYLALLRQYAEAHGLSLQAYCLMPNHVHLIATPAEAESLARALKPVHLRYAQEFNRRTDLVGVLWQGRFYSCPMDEPHFWAAVRYVERNPVRAGLVDRAEDYPFSSAAFHCARRGDALLCDVPRPDWLRDWSEWLAADGHEPDIDRIRHCTRTGRPAGGESFIDRLELLIGRPLRPKKGGRPRKKGNEEAKHGDANRVLPRKGEKLG